jgi:hypothetical protein
VPLNVWILGAVNWVMFFAYVFLLGRITGVSATGKVPRWMKKRQAPAKIPAQSAPAQPAPQPAALVRAQK